LLEAGADPAEENRMPIFGSKRNPSADRLLAPLRTGRRRYRSLKKVGEGGLARVSSTLDTFLNRVVAVKELKPAAVRNPDLLRAFLTEAKLIGYLDHPGVVSIFDTYLVEKDKPCYTMPLLRGRTGDEIFDAPPRAVGEIVERLNVFVKLAETMAYVHGKGVIHLDIKPENIMVGEYGEVMVLDWGNARLYDPEPYREYVAGLSEGSRLEEWFDKETEGIVLGTPAYMSPEQTSSSRRTLSPVSDVFSAGIVLYEWLTGEHPFIAEGHGEVIGRIKAHHPPPMHELNPEVPRRLSRIGAHMLAKEPSARYRDFHAVLEELHELQRSGEAFDTRTVEPGETVFTEGEGGEYAFVILAGKVEVYRMVGGTKRVLATLGPGEIVGELAIFSDVARTASVAALEPTTIRIMGRADIEKELEKLSPWVDEMITGLCRRFIVLNDKLVDVAQPDKTGKFPGLRANGTDPGVKSGEPPAER
jgi:serine/threonine-protein kinase